MHDLPGTDYYYYCAGNFLRVYIIQIKIGKNKSVALAVVYHILHKKCVGKISILSKISVYNKSMDIAH